MKKKAKQRLAASEAQEKMKAQNHESAKQKSSRKSKLKELAEHTKGGVHGLLAQLLKK